MKKIIILSALFSFTLFASCNKEEIVEPTVPAEENLVQYKTIKQSDDNTSLVGHADFAINNEDNILYEKGDLLLTNNSLNAVSYHWDFGNGNTSTEANPIYNNYSKHGPFTITLTVTDALGNTHQASHEVLVLCIFGGAPHPF